MPRPLRIHVPGVPLHVVQRGHDRAPCFFDDADYRHYLHLLREVLARSSIALNAYVLMTNHVHLLMTPSETGKVSDAMIAIGGRYVRYINVKRGRIGTLWDGRYKSSLIQTERYSFACLRYIELNPVRAGMVATAADYPWSSYRHHAYGVKNPLITPSAAYLALADSASARQAAYRDACGSPPSDLVLAGLRAAADRNRPFGDTAFIEMVEGMKG